MFGKLFGKKDNDDWTDGGIESAEDLQQLAASNAIVATELDSFMEKVDITRPETWEDVATDSAKALSGYGLSVSKQAFLSYIRLQTEGS